MRPILLILAETRHPVVITTKSALILRDRELIARLPGGVYRDRSGGRRDDQRTEGSLGPPGSPVGF